MINDTQPSPKLIKTIHRLIDIVDRSEFTNGEILTICQTITTAILINGLRKNSTKLSQVNKYLDHTSSTIKNSIADVTIKDIKKKSGKNN